MSVKQLKFGSLHVATSSATQILFTWYKYLF